jgi:predicted SAM-dependent methyltransferase
MPAAGCPPRQAAPAFQTRRDWREIRLDIDPASPACDILSSITDMASVPDASLDAAYSAHDLEHLFAHEVPVALRGVRRIPARRRPGAVHHAGPAVGSPP